MGENQPLDKLGASQPLEPQAPSESNQPTPPGFLETSSHKNFTYKFLAVLGGIVILGAGAYGYTSYLAQKRYNEVAKQAEQAKEATRLLEEKRMQDTSTSLVQVPSDWQTYRNEEYGFEFKYPGDWLAEKLDKTSIKEIISLRQIDDDGAFGVISIHRDNNTIGESEFLEGLKLLNKFEIVYNNISWKIRITADNREESLQFIDTFTNKDGVTYSLGGRYYKDREVLYNQILSTFRFTK